MGLVRRRDLCLSILGALTGGLVQSLALFATQGVVVKMLPSDNKPEFDQVSRKTRELPLSLTTELDAMIPLMH